MATDIDEILPPSSPSPSLPPPYDERDDIDDYENDEPIPEQYDTYEQNTFTIRKTTRIVSMITPLAGITHQVQTARGSLIHAKTAEERAFYSGQLITLIEKVVDNRGNVYGYIPLMQKFDLIDARNFYVVINMLSDFQSKHPGK